MQLRKRTPSEMGVGYAPSRSACYIDLLRELCALHQSMGLL